jgi:ubiquinone/menaquinone biosynthesis C-methylase UbiE
MFYKNKTQESYQATAEEYARKVADLAPKASIQAFASLLPSHAKMIDIGSVTGIDFCPNLIDIAKQTAPAADFFVMDIEHLTFSPDSFDGAWAASSLLHIPKNKMLTVLQTIHTILKDKGYFYLSVKQGKGEVLEKDMRYEGDFEKFWSYYEEEELTRLLESAHFNILDFGYIERRHDYQSHPFFRVVCQKG